nr:metallopeptidase family protein [uncultured Acetobacterium sp.]
MYTIDETETMLNEIAEEIPQELYNELNGGIVLKEEAKLHPQNKAKDLFVLGEYHRDSRLGNYIAIYYGSFVQTFGNESLAEYKGQLRRVLKHEFLHHVEGLAGVQDLEVEDAIEIQNYLKMWDKDK